MLSGLRKRVKKTGQPPGTPMYTGRKKNIPRIDIINYSEEHFQEKTGSNLKDCTIEPFKNGITWINVAGLSDVLLIEEITNQYKLHPLTVEDILNVEQRPKIDEFEKYLFITLKILYWNSRKHTFSIEQLSLAFGKDFVLSFQEHETNLFDSIKDRLRSGTMQRIRQQGTDYLAYRLIDTVVDQYFVVLEELGELIENVEELIIESPTQQNSRTLYRLKRKMLMLRKTIWPMREVISHLLQAEEKLITPFTRVYLRDVYDHVVQAIDTIEIFRDMLSSMLDMYLSSLTNRMNEIMKVLTIISTIFIPTTFIASIYGMNFEYMPELQVRAGYPFVLSMMFAIILCMLYFFYKKKWL